MATMTVVDANASDRRYGYRFGCDGVLNLEDARKLLGGCGRTSIDKRCEDGLIRKGKDGGRVVICKRSIMEYIASLES